MENESSEAEKESQDSGFSVDTDMDKNFQTGLVCGFSGMNLQSSQSESSQELSIQNDEEWNYDDLSCSFQNLGVDTSSGSVDNPSSSGVDMESDEVKDTEDEEYDNRDPSRHYLTAKRRSERKRRVQSRPNPLNNIQSFHHDNRKRDSKGDVTRERLFDDWEVHLPSDNGEENVPTKFCRMNIINY